MRLDRAVLVGYELRLQRRIPSNGCCDPEALEQRCEVNALDKDGLRFRVMVDDVYDPDEAVARLASILDEIDRGWEGRFDWPKASGRPHEALSPTRSLPAEEKGKQGLVRAFHHPGEGRDDGQQATEQQECLAPKPMSIG